MKYIPSIAFEEMSGSAKSVTAAKMKCRGFLHNKSSSIRLNHPLNNVVFGSKFWNLSRIFRIFEP